MTSRTWGPDGGGIPLSSANMNGIETDITAASPVVLANQSGASYTGWATQSGTWASDGTTINETSGATLCRARYDTKLPMGGMLVVDVEMMMVSGTGTDQHMGLLLGWSGSGVGAASFRLIYNGTTYKAEMEQDGVSGRYSATATWALGAWQKVRVIWSGTTGTFYLNGTLLGTATTLTSNTEISYLGLKANSVNAKFRNLKVYSPAVPALP